MNIAIITGASSGLGAEFARAVAGKYKELGEIWVIARRIEKLQKLADELPDAHIRPISMDLTDRDSFSELKDLLEEEKPQVRVLVNNPGYGNECARRRRG